MGQPRKGIVGICENYCLKKLLIIYPHWPPSNLAGVHRARLLANFLPEYGWQPIILSVKPEFYEELLDKDIEKTVSPSVIVHKVNAFRVNKQFRVIGDIGLRSFIQLFRAASKIIKTSKIDAVLIPVPSYYTSLLGRLLFFRFKIPYGIDYIDPWSDGIPGAHKKLSRAWLSNALAKMLEPIALKKAAFVTGVSASYYKYIFDSKWVKTELPNVGMPYGFDPKDHEIELSGTPLPWDKATKALVYAGAFLPKSHDFIDNLFQVISGLEKESQWPANHKLYFLGTGPYKEKSISEYASEAGVKHLVIEIRARFPFLHILYFLKNAACVLVIGTTEKHYTASKTFQAILSKRPVFSMLHKESSASDILIETGSAPFSAIYEETLQLDEWKEQIKKSLLNAINTRTYLPDLHKLQPYSATNSAKVLADLLNKIIP
jgi:hypothetical protein